MRAIVSWPRLAVFAVAWLALPAVAVADDCSDWTPGEVVSCPDWAMWKVLGFLAGGLLMAAGWLRDQSRPKELTREERDKYMQQLKDSEPPPDHLDRSPQADTQNSAYDPGGINMGSGHGPN